MDVNKERLFLGSCFALIATSVCFAVIGAIMGPLKEQFALSNTDVGEIAGASLWGFTISIFVLGPLCDVLGMRNLLRFAMICHAGGALIMVFANGYWMLFAGALILAMGNGTVEAACNPLVATVYADQKTKKLNQFHVWFPGGIVIGSVACFLLDKVGVDNWQIKLGLVVVPTLIYGVLFLGQKFPVTERVQSGLSFGDMVRATLARPLFLILLACMAVTASLELGPMRWVTAVLEAGNIHGILVLAWITGLMAVLRFFAGPLVHRLSPTGILVGSAVLSGAGLFWLSFANSTPEAFLSATVFAVGVCYFWPTMLGVTSERVPKSGAMGLALMGGMGMLAVGLVTTPQMGKIADRYLNEKLAEKPRNPSPPSNRSSPPIRRWPPPPRSRSNRKLRARSSKSGWFSSPRPMDNCPPILPERCVLPLEMRPKAKRPRPSCRPSRTSSDRPTTTVAECPSATWPRFHC
jgi:MFS family permease